jgi:energy-converting hydrogenase Eha subunit B
VAKPTTGIAELFSKVLKLGSITTVGIAVVAALVGFLVGGVNGLLSALIGGAIALAFGTLTVVTVWLGAKLGLAAFYGTVMGGWLLKVVLFLAAVAILRKQEFINGPVLFFTLVASIVWSLVLDSWLFTKARLPMAE